MCLQTGDIAEAEELLREALDLRRAVYLEAPKHPSIVSSAGLLALAHLVRAREGEETVRREAEARALCDEFGFDFGVVKLRAADFPYTPGAARVG